MSGVDRRPAAPGYYGEGPFVLWHFSEDASLSRFEPRPPPDEPSATPVVWAVDTRHAPLYWFPRDCPRACVWVGPSTSEADRDEFFGQTSASRLHVFEAGWLERVSACRLYAYELPSETFEPHGVGGYWVSRTAVVATRREDVGPLLSRHVDAGFEVRVTPSLWPFWRRVVSSTLEFSGCRLRNAAPPDPTSP